MIRRKFLESALTGGTLLGSVAGITLSSCAQRNRFRKDVIIRDKGKYEFLLKGGHVIDPANQINSKMDVAVAEGRIALVGKNIPAVDAKKTIDVSGLYVTPGFVDIHAHVFYTDTNPTYRWVVADDLCFGVLMADLAVAGMDAQLAVGRGDC